MSAYTTQFNKWEAGLSVLHRAAVSELTISHEGQRARLRSNPTRERQLDRLLTLVKSKSATQENWSDIFGVIANLPEDDLCFFLDTLCETYNEAELNEIVSHALERDQRTLQSSIEHFAKVGAKAKVWDNDNILIVGQAIAKHNAKNTTS